MSDTAEFLQAICRVLADGSEEPWTETWLRYEFGEGSEEFMGWSISSREGQGRVRVARESIAELVSGLRETMFASDGRRWKVALFHLVRDAAPVAQFEYDDVYRWDPYGDDRRAFDQEMIPRMALLERVRAARTAVYETWGRIVDSAAPLLNSAFSGGPQWPGLHQSWRRIDLEETNVSMFVSDGLSDPFEGEGSESDVGYGHEVAVLCSVGEAQPNIVENWALLLAVGLSMQAAGFGDFLEMARHYAAFTLEIEASMLPPKFLNRERRATLLIAEDDVRTISLPTGEAKLLVARLLTAAEAKVAKTSGGNAKALVDVMARLGSPWISSLDRTSVVP